MKLLARSAVAIAANAVGLLASGYFIPDFTLTGDIKEIFIAALVFTLINFFLKGALKLFMGPIIVLTLGVGLVFVNMALLYLLDILTQSLTILTIPALLYSSLLIAAVNFIFHLATKKE
jgi:uncharacterized membrane protein YvlD (DUF360 family)